MFYQHNHNHHKSRLIMLEKSLANAETTGAKALIIGQINQIKRAEAMFQAEMRAKSQAELLRVKPEAVITEDEPVAKRGRRKKEEVDA